MTYRLRKRHFNAHEWAYAIGWGIWFAAVAALLFFAILGVIDKAFEGA